MNFTVSVIIPVYNCESYVEKAIRSALRQPEVIEVVVVNDGSTDHTDQILNKFQKQEPKVKVFHHKSNQNKGRSASRNLGLKKAAGNFIAFLDADDFYLENRFENDKKIFKENPSTDGVYNAIGAHFYREADPMEKKKLKLTTVSSKIKPEDLFEILMSCKKGLFSIDGLTVKKNMFKRTGFFNEGLKVAEDTELILRMALKCELKSGIIDKPVAMRGVHGSNVFNNKSLYNAYELKLYESLYYWSVSNKIKLKTIERFLERIWIIRFRQKMNIVKHMFYYFKLNIKKPEIVFTYLGIKYFPVVRLRKQLFPFLYKNTNS